MAYSNPEKVRELLGVEIDDAPDALLETFIGYSQGILLRRITVRVLDEKPTGNLSQNTFTLDNQFLADVNFDMTINTLDITVYGWKDQNDIATKETLNVSVIYPLNGKLVLLEIPSDYEKITVSYSYYPNQIEWDTVQLATSYYTAMMWVQRELFLVPETHVVGRMRIKRGQTWEYLRSEFERQIHLLQTKPMDKVAYQHIYTDVRTGKKSLKEIN